MLSYLFEQGVGLVWIAIVHTWFMLSLFSVRRHFGDEPKGAGLPIAILAIITFIWAPAVTPAVIGYTLG